MDDKEVIKSALLETMDEFHNFCDKHNLVYYLVGGGLIGAIRHKGFIPWDDDLDVIMPRADYKKLLALHSEFKYPLQLDNYHLNKDYFRSCAALINNKVIVDTGGHENNITGITLDILCLYPTFRTSYMIQLHFNLVKIFRGMLIIKGKTYLRGNYSKLSYTALNTATIAMKLVPKRLLIALLNLFENIKLTKPNHFANLHGAWGAKEVASQDMLVDRELYEFDGRKYWSMSFGNADKWLANIYGNYMTLPPEDKREYQHVSKVIKVSDGL